MASSEITRKEQIVFGETGASTEFGQFGSDAEGAPATSKDLDVIQSLDSFDRGWYDATIEGSEPPRLEDRNGLDYVIFQQLAYLLQKGIPEWINSATERYYANKSVVTRSGLVYIAILGDDSSNINVQKDPATESTWWRNIPGTVAEFVTGQSGTSGGSLMQQLGDQIRQSGLIVPKLVGSSYGHTILQEGLSGTLSVTSGDWIVVAKREAGTSSVLDMMLQFVGSTNTFGFGHFFVTGRQLPGSSIFDWVFTPGALSIAGPQFTGRCMIVGSNDATDRGNYLLMEMKNTTTLVLKTLGIFNSYIGLTWEIVDPFIWNGTTLPDGSSYATYGQASDDWWRFGAGETEIWSGNQVVTAGNSYNWTSPIFTGFSNQMFQAYIIYFTDYFLFICKPKTNSLSNYTYLLRGQPSSNSYIQGAVYLDASSDDFYLFNGHSVSVSVTRIVGVNY
jgi:hypothetical protein